MFQQLEYISTVTIELTAKPNYNTSSPPSSLLPAATAILSTIHKRASGKVAHMTDSYSFSAVQPGDKEGVTIAPASTTQRQLPVFAPIEEDPAANLTFNLKLTSQERLARGEVHLPYIHQGKNHPATDVTPIVGAVDDDDDYYEDDPDADLDI